MEISDWFCCLHPDERGAVIFLSSSGVATLWQGVPLALYDGYWAAIGQGGNARRDAFLSIYRLRIGEFQPEGAAVPVPWVFYDDLPLWVEVSLVALVYPLSCTGGCVFRSFLVSVP